MGLSLLAIALPAQVSVDITTRSSTLVSEHLVGGRVQVSNVQRLGKRVSYGLLTDTSSRPLFGKAVVFSTGLAEAIRAPNISTKTGRYLGHGGHEDLSRVAGYETHDVSGIAFDFVPEYEWMVFNYIFASDEYIEYVNSRYNDVFGFFITGPGFEDKTNLALIPGTKEPITINTINHQKYSEFYLDNNPFNRLGKPSDELIDKLDPYFLGHYTFDGMTKPLQIKAKVQPGEKYHIEIMVADVSDGRYDSAIMLEGKSFTSLPDDLELQKIIIASELGNFRRTFQPTVLGEGTPIELIPLVKNTEPFKLNVDSFPVVMGDSLERIPFVSSKKDPGSEPQETNPELVDLNWKLLVNFAFDSYKMDGKAQRQIEEGMMYLKQHPDVHLLVRGHTCNMGNKVYNQRLSSKRAESVAASLIREGVPENQIKTEAWDFQQPRVENGSEENRSMNRRVEVSIQAIK